MKSASSWSKLILFLLISVGGGLIIGFLTIPGLWYQELVKPAFTPPNWLFGPAWTMLYIMIGVAGARVASPEAARSLLPIWAVQMGLNFIWSPSVFVLHGLTLGLVIIGLLLATILMFIVKAQKRDPIAALLFVPYLAWVSFATYLNASLVLLN